MNDNEEIDLNLSWAELFASSLFDVLINDLEKSDVVGVGHRPEYRVLTEGNPAFGEERNYLLFKHRRSVRDFFQKAIQTHQLSFKKTYNGVSLLFHESGALNARFKYGEYWKDGVNINLPAEPSSEQIETFYTDCVEHMSALLGMNGHALSGLLETAMEQNNQKNIEELQARRKSSRPETGYNIFVPE